MYRKRAIRRCFHSSLKYVAIKRFGQYPNVLGSVYCTGRFMDEPALRSSIAPNKRSDLSLILIKNAVKFNPTLSQKLFRIVFIGLTK